jgi:hypothetical protein
LRKAKTQGLIVDKNVEVLALALREYWQKLYAVELWAGFQDLDVFEYVVRPSILFGGLPGHQSLQ